MLSTKIEYYKKNRILKKDPRHFKTLSLFSKLIPLILSFSVLLGFVVLAY